MNTEARIQEAQYDFPYHHIPRWDGNQYSQTRHWSWGIQYQAGMMIAMDILAASKFTRLLDIGCGDGRFLKELSRCYPAKTLRGIDISQRAVDFARAFSPHIDFAVEDVINETPKPSADAITLIEVCEHIDAGQLPAFLDAVADTLQPGGLLVLTVPHQNKPLSEKHHQHFTAEKLAQLLGLRFTDLEFHFFDRRNLCFQVLLRLAGGKGNHFIITHSAFNRILFRYYQRHCLHADNEQNCLRIACSARRTRT